MTRTGSGCLAVLAALILTGCSQPSCRADEPIVVSMAGQLFRLDNHHAISVETNDLNRRYRRRDNGDRYISYCNKALVFGAPRVTELFTGGEDLDLLPDEFAALHGDIKISLELYAGKRRPDPEGVPDPVTGMNRHDLPEGWNYYLDSPGFGEWQQPIYAACQTGKGSMVRVCQVFVEFSPGIEFHLAVDQEQIPPREWPALAAAGVRFFESLRVAPDKAR